MLPPRGGTGGSWPAGGGPGEGGIGGGGLEGAMVMEEKVRVVAVME